MLAKRFALGFGIAMILPLLVYYGVNMISPAPKWEDYTMKQEWKNYSELSKLEQKKVQEKRESLEKKYDEEQSRFRKHLFYTAAPIGIASIIAGAFVPLPAIGTGLMFGGILTVTQGYMLYWGGINPQVKFLSLLTAFVVLIVVGYKKLGS